MVSAACEECGRTREQLKALRVLLDVYNDFDGRPGNLVCDECVHAAADCGPPCAMPARPEGYYHSPIGTFD